VMPAALLNADGTDAAVALLAVAHGTVPSTLFLQAASVTVVATGAHNPAAALTVALDKTSYVASDKVVATVTGPASATVNMTIYGSQLTVQPSERDSFVGTSSWGDVVQQPVSLKLDAGGHGTYSFAAGLAKRAVDMDITVAATYGAGAAQAVGARTATVYQAAAEVFLLPGRLQYREGDPVVVPFVVEARDGSRVPNAAMSYQLESTDYSGSSAVTTVVASGSVAADANGLGVVRATMNTHISPVTLLVLGKDGSGNVFQDAVGLGIDALHIGAFSGDTNARLDIVTDKLAYRAGDSAQLTVTSPTAATALVSLERGRIHQYRMVQLTKGDNALTVPVTADLAPGFDVVISYFHAGEYTSQAYAIHVNNSTRVLKVKLAPDRTSYARGDIAHVTVTVTDASGAPVAATALADAYDARMSAFKVVDKDSIAGAFLTADPLLTNGSSSLLGIGFWGGMCGGGFFSPPPDPIYPGQAVVWSPDLAIDASGRATVDVPISGPVRLTLFAGTKDSQWGQAETDLGP
jgi:Alpha-2-macroglobulin bait region domain